MNEGSQELPLASPANGNHTPATTTPSVGSKRTYLVAGIDTMESSGDRETNMKSRQEKMKRQR